MQAFSGVNATLRFLINPSRPMNNRWVYRRANRTSFFIIMDCVPQFPSFENNTEVGRKGKRSIFFSVAVFEVVRRGELMTPAELVGVWKGHDRTETEQGQKIEGYRCKSEAWIELLKLVIAFGQKVEQKETTCRIQQWSRTSRLWRTCQFKIYYRVSNFTFYCLVKVTADFFLSSFFDVYPSTLQQRSLSNFPTLPCLGLFASIQVPSPS